MLEALTCSRREDASVADTALNHHSLAPVVVAQRICLLSIEHNPCQARFQCCGIRQGEDTNKINRYCINELCLIINVLMKYSKNDLILDTDLKHL